MKVKEVENTFTLPNEVVIVKYIKRKRGLAANVDDNHVISGGMLSGSKKKFCAPLTRTGKVANVLTSEEKAFLEKELNGINLSVYGDFWSTFYVSLWKDDANNRFDLSDPMDYLSVRLLESLKNDIAPSWDSRNQKGTYQFVITRAEEEFKEKKAKLDSKKQAWKIYGKIEDDREKLIGILKLLTNQPISVDSKLDWIQGKVEEHLDKAPYSFLSIVTDKSFDTKVLINKAVDSRIIIRNSNKYETVDGLQLCENKEIPSFDNAVKYLDNPKNQEVRSLLEARVDNSK